MVTKDMIWGHPIKDLPFKLISQTAIEIWRAADFWKKERETIAWIDSFHPNSVFWDIGANVGVFSLYNAIRKGNFNTIAFEPGEENFNRLIENVRINEINSPLIYKQEAVSDFDGCSMFFVPKSGVGMSGGQVGEAIDQNGDKFVPAGSYQVKTHTIDALAVALGVPNYIKIDVDGQEWRILQGGIATLMNDAVKGVLVEVNNSTIDISGFMIGLGFTDWNVFNGADINRSINAKTHNTIFTRGEVNH